MQILDCVAKEFRSRSEYLLIQKEMQKPIPRKVALPKLGGRFGEADATEQSAATAEQSDAKTPISDTTSTATQPGSANANEPAGLCFPRDTLFTVQPKRGMALIFNHDVNHEGALVATEYCDSSANFQACLSYLAQSILCARILSLREFTRLTRVGRKVACFLEILKYYLLTIRSVV